MFAICPNEVLRNKDLNAQDIRVYMAIASFADTNGACFPSVARLADICGVSKRTIFRIINKLAELKIIERNHRIRDDGGYSSNLYLVTTMSLPSDNNVTTPSDNNVTSNKNHFKPDSKFKIYKQARASARVKGCIDSNTAILEMSYLNDVKSCKEQIKEAKQYQFVKLASGAIGIRPLSAIGQNDIIEGQIIEFLADKCGRDVTTLDFNSFSLNEIKIDI